MNVLTSFDDCFSAETIADVLSVSKRNIESWAKNGKLVPILDPATHKKPYKKEQLIQFPEFSAMFNSLERHDNRHISFCRESSDTG